jgi:phosphopantetheine adenylyltransferase
MQKIKMFDSFLSTNMHKENLKTLICSTKHGVELLNAKHAHIKNIATQEISEVFVDYTSALYLVLIIMLNDLSTPHFN